MQISIQSPVQRSMIVQAGRLACMPPSVRQSVDGTANSSVAPFVPLSVAGLNVRVVFLECEIFPVCMTCLHDLVPQYRRAVVVAEEIEHVLHL